MYLNFVITLLSLVSSAVAFASNCQTPIATSIENHATHFRVQEGQVICLHDGRRVHFLDITKQQVRLKSRAGVRDYHLSRGHRTLQVGNNALALGLQSNSRPLTLSIEVVSTLPDKTITPIACPQMDTICTEEFNPVCGRTSNGTVKQYSNKCHAMVACAEVVSDDLCKSIEQR